MYWRPASLKPMKRHAILLSGLLITGTLRAADVPGPRMASPVLGYVFDDSAKAIRSISGVPGAASLATTVPLPSLVSAFVHSSGSDAVVVTKEGKLAYASWGSGAGGAGEARVQLLDTAVSSLANAALSADRFAITDGSIIEVWSTKTPALVSRYADAAASALAVNREGVVIAAVGSSLVRFSDRGAETLATDADWSAIAFAADGKSVLAADATHAEVVLLDAEGGRTVLASLPDRVIAMAGSSDALIAALPTGLLSISAAGVVAVPCNCEPKGLDALDGSATAFVRGTQFLVDASASEPQLTRLPSIYATTAGGSNWHETHGSRACSIGDARQCGRSPGDPHESGIQYEFGAAQR